MQSVPLVATTRGYPATGNIVENVHMGSVAVVDAGGRVLWSAGNAHRMTFTRSALKPFQALPLILADGPARFGLSPAELALLCASHSAEPCHVEHVATILAKIGMDESALACGCHAPLFYDSMQLPLPPNPKWRAIEHNCSGKHSGFLAWCRLHKVSSDAYTDPGHPLQRAILQRLAEETGVAASAMPTGIDGCSAPNYAMPLSALAHLYARLARGNADTRLGSAMGHLRHAMTAYPQLVSGQGRADLAYMQAGAGDWVSKVGADAVQALGISSAGLGIAIKIDDGATRALPCATFSVLEQLGLLDQRARALLEPYRQPELKNARAAVVGDIRALFTLTPA